MADQDGFGDGEDRVGDGRRLGDGGERESARKGRRRFVAGVAGTVALALPLRSPELAWADDVGAGAGGPVASPPPGFSPLRAPGKVVRVHKAGSLQDNGLWPKQEAATAMLEQAMELLTGTRDLGRAFAKFVHPADRVAIKPNGIAGKKNATMASNKELVLAIVRGIVAAGVPASQITIYEQYNSFLSGTRCATNLKVDPEFPAGVSAAIHENKDATMDSISVGGIPTKFVRPFTEATAVINVSQFKDHSICGYTGTMKNITHGSIINPHHFHEHNASPQIAQLYAQHVCKSRVRLHIADVFKLIYDGGPLDKPERRLPVEEVYASTDAVALDVVGWQVIEKWRREKNLPTLKDAGREPAFIRTAGDLGLGVFDQNAISLREAEL
jgi:uncharacterized protein (DUF362 family)